MRTIDAVRRSGVAIGPERSIHDAAVIMAESGVGSLVIVDEGHVVGIVTDRDLVCRALAKGLTRDARIDTVMTTPVLTIDAEADLHDAFAVFRTHALRRLAVTRGAQFLGMVTVDDLLVDLVSDLGDLARPVTAEVLFAHHDSPVPAHAS